VLQLTLPAFEIALIVMIVETVIVSVLFVGWYFGSRQMKYRIHHGAVYSIILAHVLTVSLWMIPQGLLLVSMGLLNDPIGNLYQILHDIIGLLAVSLGAVLALVFLIKRGMPLKLLKKARPFMILTLIVWALAFLLGLTSFIITRLL